MRVPATRPPVHDPGSPRRPWQLFGLGASTGSGTTSLSCGRPRPRLVRSVPALRVPADVPRASAHTRRSTTRAAPFDSAAAPLPRGDGQDSCCRQPGCRAPSDAHGSSAGTPTLAGAARSAICQLSATNLCAIQESPPSKSCPAIVANWCRTGAPATARSVVCWRRRGGRNARLAEDCPAASRGRSVVPTHCVRREFRAIRCWLEQRCIDGWPSWLTARQPMSAQRICRRPLKG